MLHNECYTFYCVRGFRNSLRCILRLCTYIRLSHPFLNVRQIWVTGLSTWVLAILVHVLTILQSQHIWIIVAIFLGYLLHNKNTTLLSYMHLRFTEKAEYLPTDWNLVEWLVCWMSCLLNLLKWDKQCILWIHCSCTSQLQFNDTSGLLKYR